MTAPAHRPTPADLARPKPGPRPAQPPATPAPAPAPASASAPAPAKPALSEQPVTAADAIRPGKLRKSERVRAMFEQGIRISGMTPTSRLTALTLLGYANFQTGQIHARWRPTVKQLAAATGLTDGQVLVQLEILTSRGWLAEHTLRRGPRAGSRALQLCIPAAVLQQLRDHAARTDTAAAAGD